jgi:hypothetical protein
VIKEILLVLPDRGVNLPGGHRLGDTPMLQVIGDHMSIEAAVDSDHPRVRGQTRRAITAPRDQR